VVLGRCWDADALPPPGADDPPPAVTDELKRQNAKVF
jgi:hypothetical protein